MLPRSPPLQAEPGGRGSGRALGGNVAFSASRGYPDPARQTPCATAAREKRRQRETQVEREEKTPTRKTKNEQVKAQKI